MAKAKVIPANPFHGSFVREVVGSTSELSQEEALSGCQKPNSEEEANHLREKTDEIVF